MLQMQILALDHLKSPDNKVMLKAMKLLNYADLIWCQLVLKMALSMFSVQILL